MNINNNFSSIEQITGTYLNKQKADNSKVVSNNVSFARIFEEKKNSDKELKFSKHAGERLKQRNIFLNAEQLGRLNEAAKKADAKGIKESLMIMDDMAFIVNIKNNTVITAMDNSENSENVFTNIDGAVIA